MKALSIRQPWAWLIIKGEKPVENRGWLSNHRGPLLIHAALTFDKAGYQWVRKNFPHLKMPPPRRYPLGAIIGSVQMEACVTSSVYRSVWFSGPYGFVFSDPKEYDRPVPFKGQLGFFDVPEDVFWKQQLVAHG